MTTTGGLQVWAVDRLDDLVAVVTDALPDEGLGVEDLLVCSFEDDAVVLGTPDGDGVVVAVTRTMAGSTVGHVQVVAVAADARRHRIGSHLLAGAEAWMAAQGASHAVLGGAAPWYLWPGVDARWTAAQCLAEAAGFRAVGSEVNMTLDAAFRAPTPAGVSVVRALDDDVVAVTVDLVARLWPQWVDEATRAIEHGACLVAMDERRPIGLACHSVNRPGWLGPMGTDPAWRGRGVGAALVGAVCRDLMVAGFRQVEVSWVGPVRFYAKLGAEVSRAFRSYHKPLP